MSVNIYVGNLPYTYTNDDLEQLFQQQGTVSSAQVIMDRDTGRSRGFGFVTFAEDGDADKAMEEMDGTELDGRTIRVNEAQERRRGGRGGRGGGGGGGRGGRGGGGGGRW